MEQRPDRHRDRKSAVIPQPARSDFFEWLEKLWEDGQRPDAIEIRTANGRVGRFQYGPPVVRPKEWKPNAPRPTREQIVALSNEFLNAAQLNCNGLGTGQRYAVLVRNFTKSEGYYCVFMLKMKPNLSLPFEGDGSDGGGGGIGGDGDDDGDEEGDGLTDGKWKNKFLGFSLAHVKEGNEHRRWEQDHYSQAMGGVFATMERLIERLFEQENKKTEQMNTMFSQRLEYFKAMEDALSKRQEREIQLKKEEFKIAIQEKGVQVLMQYLPIVANKVSGKQLLPTKHSPESLACQAFIEGLKEEQLTAVFGTRTPDGQLVGDGLFTKEQTTLFFAIAECTAPGDAMDQFMPGGPCELTDEQILKAQTLVGMDQLMPLAALVMERQKAKQQQQAQQPNP